MKGTTHMHSEQAMQFRELLQVRLLSQPRVAALSTPCRLAQLSNTYAAALRVYTYLPWIAHVPEMVTLPTPRAGHVTVKFETSRRRRTELSSDQSIIANLMTHA